jgi:CheY-like chemotaxis protein
MARILLIDDEDPVREVTRAMLERLGHVVVEAGEGNAGMRQLRSGEFDLVVTDLVMPGKEGLETIQEIRRDFPDVPVVAVSAGGYVGPHTYLAVARRMGANATLTKPFSEDDLKGALKQVLG